MKGRSRTDFSAWGVLTGDNPPPPPKEVNNNHSCKWPRTLAHSYTQMQADLTGSLACRLTAFVGERGVLPLLEAPDTAKGSELGLAVLRGAAAKSAKGSAAEVGAGVLRPNGSLVGAPCGAAEWVANGSLEGLAWVGADAPNGSDAPKPPLFGVEPKGSEPPNGSALAAGAALHQKVTTDQSNDILHSIMHTAEYACVHNVERLRGMRQEVRHDRTSKGTASCI